MIELMKLQRSRCSILPLVLKGKWFDMIASGEKREEYRDLDVWNKRISKWLHRFNKSPEIQYLVVAFQRGYRKPSMWYEVTCVSSEKVPRVKHPEWGEPDEPHFVIQLGRRVCISDSIGHV